ncbi:alpha/beta hydrolase [Cellulomonas sp. WB94]|uniref:alpha/beta fold hydrolase n=1 Tax=Cellulomonas sp. WB94 TaxID=2173174 RepID=UPI000D568AFC|nr:alpha/beta hydrolase [Cellulomonas sp. WB94]PVU83528.1 alpha/beta hydrolase [Cellulomonas sp. WB94]
MDTIDLLRESRYLTRPEGRIAYAVAGDGPLVVLVPGMGDLRSTWRELVGPLNGAGYRVAALDLRGHGGSDTTFTEHGDVVTAQDLLALIEHLGGPAVVIGNSMGTSAAAWAASERPELVSGLVLVSPMLREPGASSRLRPLIHLLYRVLFARPWGVAVWATYYRTVLNKGAKAPWLDEHVRALRASMRRPGGLRSFRELTLALDHSVAEVRLGEVHAPALVVVGALDPDYPDPAAELDWTTTALDAQGVLLPGVAHYAQHQAPEVTVPATLTFLAGLPRTETSWVAPAPHGA